eukprot:3653277-Pyramimonas_sp.AAC.1
MRARSKPQTCQQQFLLLSCATDAIWTEARACDAGYLADGMRACGRRDTLTIVCAPVNDLGLWRPDSPLRSRWRF